MEIILNSCPELSEELELNIFFSLFFTTPDSTITATSVVSMIFDKFFNFSETQFADLKIGLIIVPLSPRGCYDNEMRSANLSTHISVLTTKHSRNSYH